MLRGVKMIEMNRIYERIEGLRNLISQLDDILFYVNLNPMEVSNELLNHSDKLLELLKLRLTELIEVSKT